MSESVSLQFLRPHDPMMTASPGGTLFIGDLPDPSQVWSPTSLGSHCFSLQPQHTLNSFHNFCAQGCTLLRSKSFHMIGCKSFIFMRGHLKLSFLKAFPAVTFSMQYCVFRLSSHHVMQCSSLEQQLKIADLHLTSDISPCLTNND